MGAICSKGSALDCSPSAIRLSVGGCRDDGRVSSPSKLKPNDNSKAFPVGGAPEKRSLEQSFSFSEGMTPNVYRRNGTVSPSHHNLSRVLSKKSWPTKSKSVNGGKSGSRKPSILPIQIIRVGQVIILSVPGEFTTMAGRRLRDAVKEVLIGGGHGEFNKNVHILIAGLTNTYSQYVTTFEEYQIQRYEGASTLYGPHTLSGYIQEFRKLANALITGQTISPGPQPPNLLNKQISLLPPVVVDGTPVGVKFGDTSIDVPSNSTFKRGDMVTATFWSACPRNDLMTNGTFALVQLLDATKNWVPVFDDDDFCLRFKWSRPSKLSAQSHATLEWRIPQSASPGIYRLTHFGASKNLLGSISHFTGSSSAFLVV